MDQDRRTYDRFAISRPCKIYDPAARKFYLGRTRNLSLGGALIELDRSVPFPAGTNIHVAVAQTRRQPLLHASEMIEARIVRAFGRPDGRTILAAEFLNAHESDGSILRDAA